MRIWQDIKAWYRGEKKVQGASRGRCYVKGEEPSKPPEARATASIKLTGIKITRADGNVEEIKNG